MSTEIVLGSTVTVAPIQVTTRTDDADAVGFRDSWGSLGPVMDRIETETIARTPILPGVAWEQRDRLAEILTETGRTYTARRDAGEEPGVWLQIDTGADQ